MKKSVLPRKQKKAWKNKIRKAYLFVYENPSEMRRAWWEIYQREIECMKMYNPNLRINLPKQKKCQWRFVNGFLIFAPETKNL